MDDSEEKPLQLLLREKELLEEQSNILLAEISTLLETTSDLPEENMKRRDIRNKLLNDMFALELEFSQEPCSKNEIDETVDTEKHGKLEKETEEPEPKKRRKK